MSDHVLSIIVYGRGDDPNHRSHWAFAMHRPGAELCTLFQVNLIGQEGLIYQFETRSGEPLVNHSPEGYFTVSHVKAERYAQVTQLISEEPAPRNGKDRCQDWVMSCIVGLESEELIEDGTADWMYGLVGKNVTEVAARLEGRWCAVHERA